MANNTGSIGGEYFMNQMSDQTCLTDINSQASDSIHILTNAPQSSEIQIFGTSNRTYVQALLEAELTKITLLCLDVTNALCN